MVDPLAHPNDTLMETSIMAGIMGRSIGPWGVLTVACGAVVLIPSGIALVLALAAVFQALL